MSLMTPHIRRSLTSTIPLMLLVSAHALSAQQRKPASPLALADSSAARILESADSKGIPTGVVVEVLRQQHRTYPAAKRQELADAVVARALSNPRVAADAINAIALAGSPDPTVAGIPDPEAMGRLILIHRGATNAETRRRALRQLVDQIQPARAVPYLKDVATSSDVEDGMIAVRELAHLGYGGAAYSRAKPSERPPAQAALRELYDHQLVKSPLGRSILCDLGATIHWPSSPQCSWREP